MAGVSRPVRLKPDELVLRRIENGWIAKSYEARKGASPHLIEHFYPTLSAIARELGEEG